MQYLVDHGHRWLDVKQYPLSTIGVFVRECTKQDEIKNKRSIYNTFVGSRADEKTLRKEIIDQVALRKQKLKTPPEKEVKRGWAAVAKFAKMQGK